MFAESGVPKEVANLRYEFHENKRQELISLVTKARQQIIDELDKTGIDNLNLTTSSQFLSKSKLNKSNAQGSKTARSMMTTGFLSKTMDKDKEANQKQMEIIQKIKQKEAKRFEKYIVNEERKNKILEEKEARFEVIRKQESLRNEMLK